MTRKVIPDEQNPGMFKIVNAGSGKTVVYGLPKREADDFAARMEKAAKLKKSHERQTFQLAQSARITRG